MQLRQHLERLGEGDFVDRGVNVLVFGMPGTGKTHAMCAVGHRLVESSRSVLFIPAYRLVQDMLPAKTDLELPRMLRKLDNSDLLVIDDLGYLPQGAEESEVLFTLIAERYERRSLGITSNLVFSEWSPMAERIPIKVRKVVDGILYDSESAEVIHHWDNTFLNAEARYVLGKTPESHYFLIRISAGSMFGTLPPCTRVIPANRIGSIMTRARVDAPDSALESLRVEIMTPEGPDEPIVPLDVEVVLTRSRRFGDQTLVKSPRGRFWMVRRYALLGWEKRVVRPVSQRDAIYWALRNGGWPPRERLEMLGISSNSEH